MGKASLTFILLIITIIAVLIVPGEPWKTHPPAVTVTSNYNLTEVGKTFMVNITANDINNLYLWVINMTWDPSVITITTGDTHGLKKGGVYYDVYEGPFMESLNPTRGLLVSKINLTAGTMTRLSDAFSSAGSYATGSGAIAMINFTLVSKGTTTIDINGPSTTYSGHPVMQDPSANELPVEVVDGVVTDGGPPPIWTQFSFLATVFGIIIIILEVYLLFKLITRRPTKPPEEEEEISIAIP